MDKQHRKLQQQLDYLITKSITRTLTVEEETRLRQLNEYFQTVADVDNCLTEIAETERLGEKEQCYSVYEY